MKSNFPPLDALVVFETVARRLSFARAAEELFLTPSAVSHQIAKLESFLGFMLFERLPKGILLSKAGEDYLKHISSALYAISHATNDIRQGGKNILNVHSSTSIASLWLMPRLGSFVRAFPHISLSLSASPLYSDFSCEKIDIDIRYGIPEWPHLIVEPIFEEYILPLASPALLMQEPIVSARDLLKYPLIQSSINIVQWQHWFLGHGLEITIERPAFSFDRAAMSIDAAVQGLGIALESEKIAARHIASGHLVRVFPNDTGIAVQAHFMVYPERNTKREEVTQFIQWMRSEASTVSKNQTLDHDK